MLIAQYLPNNYSHRSKFNPIQPLLLLEPSKEAIA